MTKLEEMFQVRTPAGLVDLPKLRDAIEALGGELKGVDHADQKDLQQQARKMLVSVYAKKEMSLRDFENAVSSAVHEASPDGQQYSSPPNANYWYVCDIYPEESCAIVEIGNLKRYLKVPFTVEDKVVKLADVDSWVEVERKWVEVKSS